MGEGSRDDDFETRSDRRPSASKVVGEPEFGARYKVLGKLGEGGMGEVFRAYDTELRGEVALKVVRGDRADDGASLARFRREIALARKVTSPNVLRVYDLMEHAGLRFLTMEYVEGEDLAAVMRGGRLPLERALKIFRQVCVGLAAAHDEGVVHRDLKPQNVLVDGEDRVRVADFGLARSIGDEGMTVSGAVLGSPAYMSPEQVKGEAVDERSDIYSLGIMLYQLVAGETPFRGSNAHTVMEMRLHQAPRPLHELEATTPRNVDAVAARCLAVNPAARYASVRELLAELDGPVAPVKATNTWIAPAIIGGVVVAGAAVAWFVMHRGAAARSTTSAAATSAGRASAPTPGDGAPLISVLVTNIENRAAEVQFDNTIDAVIEEALRRSLRVDPVAGIPLQRLGAELAPGAPIDLELGKALAARDHTRVVVITGAVNSAGAQFTIELTATDVADRRVVLAAKLDIATLGNAIPALARWSYALRRALGEPLPVDGADAAATGWSTNLAAVHDLVAGRNLVRSGDNAPAIAPLQHAVELDPDFAYAYDVLALSYGNVGRTSDADRANREALLRLDRLNDRDRLGFVGDYNSNSTGDYEAAIAAYEELLRKWPKDRKAEINIVDCYEEAHEDAKAVAAGQRAVRDYPRDPVALTNLVSTELEATQFADARRDAEKGLRIFATPTYEMLQGLAMVDELEGRDDDAIKIFDTLDRMQPARAALVEADFALSESRLSDAVAVLEKGLAVDRKIDDQDDLEDSLVMLGETRLRLGDKRGAIAAVLPVKKSQVRQFEAEMVRIAADDERGVPDTVDRLERDPVPMVRALAKLLVAESARVHGKWDVALAALHDAQALDDSWLVHFLRAKTLFGAGRFADAEAELAICEARRGGGSTSLLDEMPNVRMVAQTSYWLARTQEALAKPEAKATYAEFLAHQSTTDRDPLVIDALKRSK